MLSKIKAILIMFEFIVTVMVVIVLMYIFGKNNRTVRRSWAKMQKYLMGYKIIKNGNIDEEANLIVINHQSLVDIIVLEDLHPKNLSWVTKDEINKLPIFGHIVKAPKMIAVKREDKRSMLKLFKDVKDRVSDNRVVAIFPEGTRGKGDKLLKFKNGTKFLAEKLNLKVQPIVISGSRKVFDSQNMTASCGNIHVKFLPSFYPKKDTTWFEDMQKNMQKELDFELANDTSYR